VVFAQTLFTRALDPVVPQIAADFMIEVSTAALLSSAFAFPYALVQPALGTIGDFFGKTRLMNWCVLIVALSALACAVATSFSFLVAMRVAAGIVAGGVFPIGMALIGDLVPINQRQVSIARLLAVGLTGNLLGATLAGVIGDLLGWRGVFGILGLFGRRSWRSSPSAASRRRRPRLSIAPPSWRTSAASSPIHAPRSASAPCFSKRSSSTGCFPTWRSSCWRPARPRLRSPGC
jgi:predicted MFS family arabinose efflux permease